MKDLENIKSLNKVAVSYIILSGISGKPLDTRNPFMNYILYSLIQYDESNENETKNTSHEVKVHEIPLDGIEHILNTKNIQYVPNNLFHALIQESYTLYNDLDNIPKNDADLNQKLSMFLGNIEFEKFKKNIIDDYRKSLINILINYNSKRKDYNITKVAILLNEMNLNAKYENYQIAAFYRDKIKEIEKEIEK